MSWENFETSYRTQLPRSPHELDLFFKSLRTPPSFTFRLVVAVQWVRRKQPISKKEFEKKQDEIEK
jgi:hypothetical protein